MTLRTALIVVLIGLSQCALCSAKSSHTKKTSKPKVAQAAPVVGTVQGYKDFVLGMSWKSLQEKYQFERSSDDPGTYMRAGDEDIEVAGANGEVWVLPMTLTVSVHGDTVEKISLTFSSTQQPTKTQAIGNDLLETMKRKYTAAGWHRTSNDSSIPGLTSMNFTIDSYEGPDGNSIIVSIQMIDTTVVPGYADAGILPQVIPGLGQIEVHYVLAGKSSTAGDL